MCTAYPRTVGSNPTFSAKADVGRETRYGVVVIWKAALAYTFLVTRLFRRILAAFLLAWFPWPAVALPALTIACELEEIAAHQHPAFAAEHDHSGTAAHPPAVSDDGVGSAAHDHGTGSGCCHHLYSATLPVSIDTPRESGSSLDLTPLASLSSFFPEQPQRPPLA